MLSILLAASLSAAPAAAPSNTPTDEANRDRMICRSRPVLGSRIARQRICMTGEQWRLHANDLEQSRRDINDRGARGCGTC